MDRFEMALWFMLLVIWIFFVLGIYLLVRLILVGGCVNWLHLIGLS
jgi:hypothetical protein